MNYKPVMLAILDGWGLAPESEGNAVARAHTPHMDSYWQRYPHTELEASGEAVGLPKGQIGNSEVGHLNIGAGRVVKQSLPYIQAAIDSSTFFENAVLSDLLDKSNALHLLGLLSDGGVHSDIQHLMALLELAAQRHITTYVHVFSDGRDVSPDSGLGFVEQLEQKITQLQDTHHADIRIATVTGRYYAMDRDKRWERIKSAYDAVVCGEAAHQAASASEAVAAAYARGETDEFIQATIIGDAVRMQDGDGVFFYNFRADRARQLSYALLGEDNWQEFTRCTRSKIHYASMMEYAEDLQQPFAFALPEISQPLAEVLATAGKQQYHTAETEKYPHVTYFFNAKVEEAFSGESRQIVPSPKVATYDLQPEMSAPALTAATLQRIQQHDDDFLLINYANPDMVGHTGDVNAAIQACQAVDAGLGQLVEAMLAKDGVVIVIADHGNAEKMLTEQGKPHTAHTTNRVPCILISKDATLQLQAETGILGDVAPTVLQLLGVAQPDVMTGTSLLL